jgi:hypothetical protein
VLAWCKNMLCCLVCLQRFPSCPALPVARPQKTTADQMAWIVQIILGNMRVGGWMGSPACMQGVRQSGGDGCLPRVASWAPPWARCPCSADPPPNTPAHPRHCSWLCRCLLYRLLQINASEATIFKAWHPDAEMVFNMGGQDLEVGGRVGGWPMGAWVVHVCDAR